MATSDRKILEYALKGLLAERDLIESEITELRARIGGGVARARRRSAVRGVKKAVRKKASAAKKKGRKKMTAAQRKLISKRMKEAWARRKAGE